VLFIHLFAFLDQYEGRNSTKSRNKYVVFVVLAHIFRRWIWFKCWRSWQWYFSNDGYCKKSM